MPRRRYIALAICAILAALAALPPKKVDAFAYMPDGAVAVGTHPALRSTWKKQLRHPAIASVLASFGEEAEKMARESGAFWTFLLAIGDELATAVYVGDDGRHYAAAASPAGRRGPLLRLFWAIRWVPGLGRIQKSPDGVHFIDLTDEDDPDAPKLILSIVLDRGVLAAKLSDHPIHMDDMVASARNGGGFREKLHHGLPETAGHRIVVLPGALTLPGFDREIAIDLSMPGTALQVDASLPILERDANLRELMSQKVAGINSTAMALASAHAFAFALLPSRFAAARAIPFLGCRGGKASSEDAAAYMTTAPYGAQLFLFAVPALTVSIPGIALDEATMRAALRPLLPKQLRSTFALCGQDALCSSAASLRQQRHAAPPPPYSWKDAFASVAGLEPSAFAFIDFDIFMREARAIAQAIGVAASFSRDAFDPEVAAAASTVSNLLPRFPSGLYVTAALMGGGGICRARLALGQPPGR